MLVADPVTVAKSGNSSDSVPGPKLAVSAAPEHGNQVSDTMSVYFKKKTLSSLLSSSLASLKD